MHRAREPGSLRAPHSDPFDLNRYPEVGGTRAFFCMATIWLPCLPEIRNYFGALWCDVRPGIVARQISILIWWWFTNSSPVCGSQRCINGSHRASQNRMHRNSATVPLPCRPRYGPVSQPATYPLNNPEPSPAPVGSDALLPGPTARRGRSVSSPSRGGGKPPATAPSWNSPQGAPRNKVCLG